MLDNTWGVGQRLGTNGTFDERTKCDTVQSWGSVRGRTKRGQDRTGVWCRVGSQKEGARVGGWGQSLGGRIELGCSETLRQPEELLLVGDTVELVLQYGGHSALPEMGL